MKTVRFWSAALTILLALALYAGLVWAFAEEPLYFRDPYTGQLTDEEVSTIHDDATYALALAAGFSVSDSIRLQIWNQLVDSEQLGPGTAISYTNCTGSFAPPPRPAIVCGAKPHSNDIWPMWNNMKDPDTCVTSRMGPYSPFFHFPHNNDRDLGALRDWAWGITDTLVAYEAYAWGGPGEFTVMQASCLYTRTAVISTAIQAGSLEAFATYLHSLADYYSHRECIAAMDALGMPWATHTLTGVTECNYNPANPQPDDVHGREFYTYTDSLRTDEALRAVYAELSARSVQREGIYLPLDLNAPLSGTETLSDMLSVFVHSWTFDQAEERRAQADRIVQAVLAAPRVPIRRVYLPLVIKQ